MTFWESGSHVYALICVHRLQPREQELLMELEEKDRQLALAAKLGQSLVRALPTICMY